MKSLKTNFWLDTLIFGGFLLALQPRVTGIAIHEWLSTAAAGTLALHVALHWDWVAGVTRTFFRNLFHTSRLHYVLDVLLFVTFTVVMTSGLVISRVVMPAFGLQMDASRSWTAIHNISANLSLFLIALHFALHWSWVKNTFHRLLIAPFQRRSPQQRPQSQPSLAPVSRSEAL